MFSRIDGNVFAIIGTFLLPSKHVQLSVCCKSFRSMVANPKFWRPVTLENPTLEQLSTYSRTARDSNLAAEFGRFTLEIGSKCRVKFCVTPKMFTADEESKRLCDLALRHAPYWSTDDVPCAPLNLMKGVVSLKHNQKGDIDVSFLSSMGSLRSLALMGRPATIAPPVPTLLSLTIADVGHLQNLGKLPLHQGLKQLCIDNCAISDISHLSCITSLEVLSLIRTKVTSLDPIRGAPSLKTVEFDCTPIESLEPLTTCPNLVSLFIPSANFCFYQLAKCAKLKKLVLHGDIMPDVENINSILPLETLVTSVRKFDWEFGMLLEAGWQREYSLDRTEESYVYGPSTFRRIRHIHVSDMKSLATLVNASIDVASIDHDLYFNNSRELAAAGWTMDTAATAKREDGVVVLMSNPVADAMAF